MMSVEQITENISHIRQLLQTRGQGTVPTYNLNNK